MHIAALHIYPVKSCRGISLPRSQLSIRGLDHDREWLIVKPDGRFVTQRELPALALIETAIDQDHLMLNAPGKSKLVVPLTLSTNPVQVIVWRDSCAAFDAGSDAAQWLTDYLGAPHRLVRFDPAYERVTDPVFTGAVKALSRFPDAYPLLVISEGSLADLNGRLQQPLPMNRFRPNVVLSGTEAFAEDHADPLTAGDVQLRAVKGCTRCIVTTTNQQTAIREGDEPLKTLRSYRFDRALKGVTFGQNMIVLPGSGSELTVGQQVEIRSRRAS